MGEYDISKWRLAGTKIHTPSDPKMATGVRTGFTPPSQSVVTARKTLKRGREDPNGLQTPPSMSQGHMEAPHTS